MLHWHHVLVIISFHKSTAKIQTISDMAKFFFSLHFFLPVAMPVLIAEVDCIGQLEEVVVAPDIQTLRIL